MLLSEVFRELGKENLAAFVRGLSIGKLKTYQSYESFKTHARLAKLNTETLRKAAPRFWTRLNEGDEDFARELAHAILLTQLDLVQAVLGFLGIPNQDGFFAKGLDAAPYLTAGWQQRVYDKFHGAFPEPALLLYINHLAWELDKQAGCFMPSAAYPSGAP